MKSAWQSLRWPASRHCHLGQGGEEEEADEGGGTERESHCSSSVSISCTSIERVSRSRAGRGRERKGRREGGKESHTIGYITRDTISFTI